MKKNNQILIGTHNKGKFKELSFLLPKKLKKIAPSFLNIKSPAETGKSYSANSKIKAIHFCKYSKLNSISIESLVFNELFIFLIIILCNKCLSFFYLYFSIF